MNNDGDEPVEDRVPVLDGELQIDNELAVETRVVFDLSNDPSYDGDTLYIFRGGRPNTNQDGTMNSQSSEFNINLNAGPNSATWEPGYRGYLMGTRDIPQSDFAVNGPSLVSYILRDPPGSQSFAERTVETSSTTESTFVWNAGGGGTADIFINAGVEFATGIGYTTPTKLESSTNIAIENETTGGTGGSIIEKITNTETWTTSADPLLAGPQSDLFIGTSDVFLFGISTTVTFVPDSTCVNMSIDCETDIPLFPGDYRLANVRKMALAKSGIATDFALTRWKIETDEIPDLQAQRNNLIDNGLDYESNLDADHPCFGFNNDDPRFGTPECPGTNAGTGLPFKTTMADRDGPSYTFNTLSPERLDSVRVWNQSIRLWQEALALDEQHKAEAVARDNPEIGNKTFQGAGGNFTRTISNGIQVVNQQQYEFMFKETLSAKFGAEIAGVGGSDDLGISLIQNKSSVDIQTADTTHTVSFTLSDDSEWDDFTVNIHEGGPLGSPIFDVLGGRSSCPHEDTFKSKYYQPGTVLSGGTIKLEQPEILITPPVLNNVPQDESGVFQLELRNNNDVGEGWEYATQVINTTNPNSLAINVGSSDDLSLNWVINPGEPVTRDFFVEIGTAYENRDIMVVMHSTCQYQQGLSVEPDIVDTAFFSINFIPGCTDVELSRPGDQWVLNNSFNNQLELRAEGYDINYLNLDFIRFEYKQTSSPDWLPLETYYKDSVILETNPDARLISRETAYSSYNLNLDEIDLPDGTYDLRAISNCQVAESESPVYTGVIDRINPHAFGVPSPGDGILDPEDNILMKFNELIDIGSVAPVNITVTGVTNGTELSENASVSFDGDTHYATIPEYQFQKRDFTVEFWLQRGRTGEEVIVSQGSSLTDQLYIGFNSENKVQVQLGNRTGIGEVAITDQVWHHYAISYDRTTSKLLISIDNADPEKFVDNFTTDYEAAGPIYIARHEAGSVRNFQGKMREFRLWSTSRRLTDIAPKSTVTLSGREEGLIGNWPMNEIYGTVAKDKVRSRHMELIGANWAIDPLSHAYTFDGGSDSLRVINAGQLSILDDSDITIEAWIKTTGSGQNMSIISNGESIAASSNWNIYLNPAGQLVIANNGNEMIVPTTIDNNKWNHIAIVVERTRSVSVYLNGALTATGNASQFVSFGGPSLYLGVKGIQNNNQVNYSDFFIGQLDDVRIWALARKPEQISRDFVNQLSGNELGLRAYFPFDEYNEGNNVYVQSLTDATGNGFDLSPMGISNSFTTATPQMKLPRRVESLQFDFSLNGDELIIVPDIDANLIENVTLDITVEGVKDLAGNLMAGESWIAYVNKNQVFWETEYYKVEKDIDGSVSFTAKVKNTGGRQEQYNITNIPDWMRVSPISGTIEPNSDLEVTFTIDPGVNIGEYEQDIFVSTERFMFNERFLVDLKVSVAPPEWTVDETAFSFNMNMIGELKINDLISTDDEDIVSVWVNDELRGHANVAFDENSRKHLVFLSIFSNNTSGNEPLEFRAWDASRGSVLVDLDPSNLSFSNNALLGTPSAPIPILATVFAEREYVLNEGWNWVSFPLNSQVLNNVNLTLQDLDASTGDQVKSQVQFNTYNGSSWIGNIPGFNTNEGYKIKVANGDTFSYSGEFNDPSNEPINIEAGWNWIGVKSEFLIDVPFAFSNLSLQTGDLIKGQTSFAIYDTQFGLSGNLSFLEPGDGYMLFFHTDGQLIYPGAGGASLREGEVKERFAKSAEKNPNRKSSLFHPGKYSSTMSLTAAIEACQALDDTGAPLDLTDWSLAAFAGGEIRGISTSNWNPALDKYLFYVSIEGDNAIDLNFRLINENTGEVINLNQGFEYVTNSIQGSIRSPFLFTCGERVSCDSTILFRTVDIYASQSFISRSAATSLKSNAILPNGVRFRFAAGEEVEFLKGFQTHRGAVLEAFIESCNN